MTETADLSALGAPAEVLAKLPVRRMDEAPEGLVVRKEGDGGPPLTPAHWVSGEEARLAARDKPLGIRVQAIVDTEGRVRQPVVAASTSPVLTYAALEAMRGWRFTPAQAEGRPVASFYELKVPVAWPLDRIVALSKSLLAGPLELVKQGRYAQAEKKVAGLWQRAHYEQSSDQSAAFFGVAMLEKALAEAGLGREDAALCRYQAAQTLEPHLYSADLSPYGAVGALLMQHPWGSERRSVRWVGRQPKVSKPGRLLPGPTLGELLGPTLGEFHGPKQEAVTRPALVSRRNPEFPEYARRSRLDGTVIVESIITERGTPREMLILKPSPTPGFDASALDALCDWRFKPATWRGQPVKVYYTLTVNFEVGR
jgi:TonB family protein